MRVDVVAFKYYHGFHAHRDDGTANSHVTGAISPHDTHSNNSETREGVDTWPFMVDDGPLLLLCPWHVLIQGHHVVDPKDGSTPPVPVTVYYPPLCHRTRQELLSLCVLIPFSLIRFRMTLFITPHPLSLSCYYVVVEDYDKAMMCSHKLPGKPDAMVFSLAPLMLGRLYGLGKGNAGGRMLDMESLTAARCADENTVRQAICDKDSDREASYSHVGTHKILYTRNDRGNESLNIEFLMCCYPALFYATPVINRVFYGLIHEEKIRMIAMDVMSLPVEKTFGFVCSSSPRLRPFPIHVALRQRTYDYPTCSHEEQI